MRLVAAWVLILGAASWVASAESGAGEVLSGTAATTDAAATTSAVDYYTALDEAVAAARAGERARGRELFLDILANYPARPEGYYNLGITYEYDSDGARYGDDELLSSAVAYYQSALELDPGFLPARYNLAVVWSKLGFADEAARNYRVVMAAGGVLGADAEYNLALLLKEQGRPAEATDVLSRSKTSLDDSARVRLLALCAEDQGDIGRAIALWKRMLALDDRPPYNALAQKHLATLRGY